MSPRLIRLLIPGLVVQAVLVGGGYSTGRELVEFFLVSGPATALLGMALTAVLFSVGSMVSFELARRSGAFDYRSFCRLYLGRAWVVFEWGYLLMLLLVLSVVSAAAGELLRDMTTLTPVAGSALFMAGVAFCVFFGSSFVERLISIWSVVFYVTYGGMLALVIAKFGSSLRTALEGSSLNGVEAIRDSVSYAGYNIAILPVLIFVARNLRSRNEAFVAGALAGPLILLPGFAFLLALSAFFPKVNLAALPVSIVLGELGNSPLETVVRLVILGAFAKTGIGLLHGLNERVAGSLADRNATMRRGVRSGIALGYMLVAVYLASRFGIIDLIARGYRFSSYFFLVVFVIPLLTRGLWLVLRQPHPARTQCGEPANS